MRYTKDNLGKYRQQLMDLGITKDEEMVAVMNFLAQLAEIAVEVYYQKQANGEVESLAPAD